MMNLAQICLPLALAVLPFNQGQQQAEDPPTPPPFEAPPDVVPEVEGAVFTRFYHESGALAREGYLKDGVRTGVWKAWDESGARLYHGAFRDYRRVGPWVVYGKGARATSKGYYDEQGRRHGVWANYGNRGDVRLLVRYDHGVQDGALERFTRGGLLVERTNYKQGLRDGASVRRSTGAKELLEKGSWSSGKRVGPWEFYHPEGALQRSGVYADGREEGEWVRYFQNGKRESIGRFEAGRAVGTWTGYYKQGERRFVAEFVNGIQEGAFTEWWRSGQVKAKGDYKAGVYEGPWQFWSAEGQLDTSRSGRYSKGALIQ
jgi:antitoxin component YwqK of YwqJK toxin-antitoxin module